MASAQHTTLLTEQSEFAESRAAEKAEGIRRSVMATRTVASHSVDAADCRSLLAMLGLEPGETSED